MYLTAKQQIRVDVISRYLDGIISGEDACLAVNIGERQFRRLVKAFREKGILSVIHGNKGRLSPNATPDKIKNLIIKFYKTKYLGLNLLHFIEKLKENHSLEIYLPCYSTIRNILKNEGLLTLKMNRKKKVYKSRKRYEKEGLMVQIDGSPHHWVLNLPPCCLTAAIDDATGKILGGKFTPTETTFAAMDVVESIIIKHGIFHMLYTDKAGIYGGGKRDNYSNMIRAMGELDIIAIQANSPQAKGRIERLFRTLQDRLTAEMRLRGVASLEEANEYFQNEFIDNFNKQFARVPVSQECGYRYLSPNKDLDNIFTIREDRVIQTGHVVSYEGEKYLIENEEWGCLVKRHVEIRRYRNKNTKIFLGDKELRYHKLKNPPLQFAA